MAADLTVRIAPSIASIGRAAWDACANPAPAEASVHDQPGGQCQGPPPESGVAISSPADDGDVIVRERPAGQISERHNPFISFDFLASLESAGAVGARTGWQPAHVAVSGLDDALLACAPVYLKSHSMGEYVFDHSWADAYARAGGDYYPKLQVSVPFTPATGKRLLVAPGASREAAQAALIGSLRALRDQAGASSVHATFLPREQWDTLGQAGFLQRTDRQFHFFNEDYGTFEGFLSALASRKRKMIRRERRESLVNGISIEWVTGRDLTEAHWDAFFAFYMDTGSRKWGRPYLNRKFFSAVSAAMNERILLVMAKRAGRYIAGALNFIGDDALYGRNWGAIEQHPMLHFEVCYYQAIEFAIARGLKRVEAGAQGEHKLARGYRPVLTYSAHDIADPRLRRAIADYLVRERLQVEEITEVLADHIPFRRDAEREIDAV